MATPPFSIAETLPEDDDFASQFPAVERTFRDVVESWLLVMGNTSGRLNSAKFDDQAVAPTGVADVTTVWSDADGYLMFRRGTGAAMFLEVPPGVMFDWGGGNAPEGYLLCTGAAVSRTGTTAKLFNAIGTQFGVGNGSSTFNIPDSRGRVIASPDAMGGISANRITIVGSNVGNSTGAQTKALSVAEIPTLTSSVLIAVGEGNHGHSASSDAFGVSAAGGNVFAGGGGSGLGPIAQTITIVAGTLPQMTGTALTTGTSGTAWSLIQHTLFANKIIKF